MGKCHKKCGCNDCRKKNESFDNLTVCKAKITKLVLKDDITLTVPSECYPTIQSAVDYFNGRDAMHGTIIVTPGGGSGPNGAYVESVTVNKWVSSRDNFTGQGFKIVGDNRNIMGTTFLQNGVHTNQIPVPGFGTDAANITLSNALNVITITLSAGPAINFAQAGVVVGDKIKIRSNTGAWTLATVISLAGNTLTHNGGTIAVGTIGSAVILVPNTELVGAVAGQPAFAVEKASINLVGFWINSDVTHGAVNGQRDNIFIYDGASCGLECCLFDGQTGNLTYGNATAYDHSSFVLSRNNDIAFGGDSGIVMPITVIGEGILGGGYLITDVSASIGGTITVFDAPAFISQNSEALVWTGQSIGSPLGGFAISDVSFLFLGTYRAFQSLRGVQSTRESAIHLGLLGGAIIDGGVIGTSNVGILVLDNANVTLQGGPINISNVRVGINAARNGTVAVVVPAAVPVFGAIGAGGTVSTTVTSTYDNTRNIPGNVFNNIVSPPFGLEDPYINQIITAAAPINITLNPGATTIAATAFKYIGKTYTITSKNTAAHTVTVSGPFIERFGLPNTTVMRFSTTFPNSFVTFLVQSTTSVQILNSQGVTFT